MKLLIHLIIVILILVLLTVVDGFTHYPTTTLLQAILHDMIVMIVGLAIWSTI